MSMMHFRMKQQRPITTAGTRQLESSVNNGMSRLTKQITTPKMLKERECLYDENIQLKQSVNELRRELQQTKLRNGQLEKELQRFESVIEDQSKNVDQQSRSLEKYGLVLKLKNKQKQLIQELLIKTREVNEIKRSTKYTHQQELEIELQNYLDETLRLRQQLEFVSQMVSLQGSGESLEKRVLQQEKTLKILQKDNQELQQNLANIDQTTRIYKVKYEDAAKQNERLENELIQQQELNHQLKEYVKQCNDIIEEQKKAQNLPLEEIKLEFNSQIEQMKGKNMEELEQKNKEIRDLTTEIYKQSIHVQELERLLEQQEEFLKERQANTFSPNYLARQSANNTPEPKGKQFALEIKPSLVKRRLPKVQFYEIRAIAMKIKYNLHKNKTDYEDLDELFYDDELSIIQVKDILSNDPIALKNEEEQTLLARYLVEDNQDDFIIFEENRKNSTAIIKSVMKRVVGRYNLFSEEEDTKLYDSIQKKMHSGLLDTVQMIIAKKKHLETGTCELVDWDAALKFHEIVLTPREQEKFQLILFEMSKSIDIINYSKVIKYFQYI